jgi:hypothetical protein
MTHYLIQYSSRRNKYTVQVKAEAVFFGLWKCSLKQMPKEIGFLTQLESLGLEHNYLSQLLPSIQNLTRLRSLGCSIIE